MEEVWFSPITLWLSDIYAQHERGT